MAMLLLLCIALDKYERIFVAFFGEKHPRALPARGQSADKAHKRKNCPDKKEAGGNFCFRRQLHLQTAVTYV